MTSVNNSNKKILRTNVYSILETEKCETLQNHANKRLPLKFHLRKFDRSI